MNLGRDLSNDLEQLRVKQSENNLILTKKIHGKKKEYLLCPDENCNECIAKRVKIYKKDKIENDLQVVNLKGKFKFVCPYENCSKAVVNIRRHIRNHRDNSFKYVCESCGKVFTEINWLKYHKQAIHEENVFKCSFQGCNKQFGYKQNLRTHERIHKNEYFNCFFCSKKYTQLKNLDRHVKKHHPNA